MSSVWQIVAAGDVPLIGERRVSGVIHNCGDQVRAERVAARQRSRARRTDADRVARRHPATGGV